MGPDLDGTWIGPEWALDGTCGAWMVPEFVLDWVWVGCGWHMNETWMVPGWDRDLNVTLEWDLNGT